MSLKLFLELVNVPKVSHAAFAMLSASVLLSANAISTTSAHASDVRGMRVFNSNFQAQPVDAFTLSTERFAGTGLASGNRKMAATIGQWMDTSLTTTLRSFNVSANLGDGVNSVFGFRHSQTDDVDPMQWNGSDPLSSTSELYLTQRVGGTWLHAMGTSTAQESRIDLGVRRGAFRLNVGAGSGRSLVRLGGTFSDLNPWFFAGGRNVGFDFNGATATLDFSGRTTAELGQWSLDMQELGARKTRFVGLRSGSVYGRLYDISRDDIASVASGLELGFRGKALGLSYRHVEDLNGASTQRLSMVTAGPRETSVGLSFGRDINPNYLAAQDTRMMLTLSGRFGHTRVMRQTDTNSEGEAQEESHTMRNVALIGGGALVLAAAAGGGGGGEEPNGRFAREEGAAFSVLNSVNPRCVAQNREYGGWIYRFNDGSYSFLNPVQGDTSSVNIGGPDRVPNGTRASATYHCHGGPDPRFNNESFSPQDIFADRFFNVNGYLSTPAGQLKKHNVSNGQIQTIGKVNIK